MVLLTIILMILKIYIKAHMALRTWYNMLQNMDVKTVPGLLLTSGCVAMIKQIFMLI